MSGEASPAPERRTVLELLTLAAAYLAKRSVPSARREADALLGHVLECDRLHLYLRFEERPTPKEVDLFRGLMVRRGEREPLQYCLGAARFLDLTLACDRRALIPRPETEDLARRAAGLAPGGRCADIGTGTGCIALHLASQGWDVLATDRSPEALSLAAENAARLGLEGKVRFVQGDLWAPLDGEAPLDLIVSNPPYIPQADRETLQPEVGRWEPPAALFAGPDGLDFLRPLVDGAAERLAPGGWLALECGLGQAAPLLERALAAGAWGEARVHKDSFDVERFLFCRRS